MFDSGAYLYAWYTYHLHSASLRDLPCSCTFTSYDCTLYVSFCRFPGKSLLNEAVGVTYHIVHLFLLFWIKGVNQYPSYLSALALIYWETSADFKSQTSVFFLLIYKCNIKLRNILTFPIWPIQCHRPKKSSFPYFHFHWPQITCRMKVWTLWRFLF